jgi:hypothetical protein
MTEALAGWDGHDELEEIRFRRSKAPSVEQREKYLEEIADGVPHFTAARLVGSTARAFRGLRKRDIAFDALCVQAEKQSDDEGVRESFLRGSLWDILHDPKHPKHWEALRYALDTYLEETEFKRTRQIEQKVKMEGALAHTLQIPIERLRQLPNEEIERQIEWMRENGVTAQKMLET